MLCEGQSLCRSWSKAPFADLVTCLSADRGKAAPWRMYRVDRKPAASSHVSWAIDVRLARNKPLLEAGDSDAEPLSYNVFPLGDIKHLEEQGRMSQFECEKLASAGCIDFS